MGAPLTAEFDSPQHAYAGLQISHYGLPTEPGYVFETWFNPPVSQALNMPGWFEQHFENMRRYDHLMAVGVIVGTGSYGSISKALTGGPGINFTPRKHDLETMARGLKLLGRHPLRRRGQADHGQHVGLRRVPQRARSSRGWTGSPPTPTTSRSAPATRRAATRSA